MIERVLWTSRPGGRKLGLLPANAQQRDRLIEQGWWAPSPAGEVELTEEERLQLKFSCIITRPLNAPVLFDQSY